MGRLIDFYKQHRRLFLSQKHQNTRQQERHRDMVAIKFFDYCESKNIFHTGGTREKQIAMDFLNTPKLSAYSYETRRKYFMVLSEIYERFHKIDLNKEEILK